MRGCVQILTAVQHSFTSLRRYKYLNRIRFNTFFSPFLSPTNHQFTLQHIITCTCDVRKSRRVSSGEEKTHRVCVCTGAPVFVRGDYHRLSLFPVFLQPAEYLSKNFAETLARRLLKYPSVNDLYLCVPVSEFLVIHTHLYEDKIQCRETRGKRAQTY